MKHKPKITIILLAMFVITQFIGLYVVDHYSKTKIIDGKVQNVSAPELPFGMDTPRIEKERDYYSLFPFLIIAFVIAISLFIIFTKFNFDFIIKLWFFIVVAMALGISFNSFLPGTHYSSIIVLAMAIPLAFIKIYQKSLLVHNLTELFIYPGIAAVFVPILNIYTVIVLLILISLYDMWAVWKSGIMQKMVKYQTEKLNLMAGFFIPHIDKKTKEKIKKMKKTLSKEELKKKRIKINVALLGGGDVIFPIITAGVMMKTFGFLSSIFVVAGATLGLGYLFFFSEKKKFYPAMPFITAGIFLGIILGWFVS